MGMFEIFRGKNKDWRFRLRADNGKVIAQSEGYTSRRGVLKGIKSIKRIAAGSGTMYKI
jgi:uncharacterized protein